jgi:hypothetical protein
VARLHFGAQVTLDVVARRDVLFGHWFTTGTARTAGMNLQAPNLDSLFPFGGEESCKLGVKCTPDIRTCLPADDYPCDLVRLRNRLSTKPTPTMLPQIKMADGSGTGRPSF